MLKSKFLSHPAEKNFTYWQHLVHALKLSGALFRASFCVAIHAFFPFVFITTASNTIRELNQNLQ